MKKYLRIYMGIFVLLNAILVGLDRYIWNNVQFIYDSMIYGYLNYARDHFSIAFALLFMTFLKKIKTSKEIS